MDFVLALHSHLPYVLNHGRWPHGSDWLCEAAVDTYLPLVEVLNVLEAEEVPSPVTLGVTPVLANQLAHPTFARELDAFLTQRLEACEEAIAAFRHGAEEELIPIAVYWRGRLARLRRLFDRLDRNLAAGLRRHEQAGRIELMSSAATHGFLPLLGREESIRLQLAVGRAEHVRLFGREPAGCWVPECAYRPRGVWHPHPAAPLRGERPGIEEHLADAGYRYFFCDAHVAEAGKTLGLYREAEFPDGLLLAAEDPLDFPATRSPYQTYQVSPQRDQRMVAAFVRDPRSSRQVWSRYHGYPGDGGYLEFHKIRYPGGLKFWRVTGPDVDLGGKQPYDPNAARARAHAHAAHYRWLLRAVAEEEQRAGGEVIVAPFDTELFGHWWFEGVEFLADLFRGLQAAESPRPRAASAHLSERPSSHAVELAAGSWGANGDFSKWLNRDTEWTWERLWPLEDRFWDVAPEALRRPETHAVLAQAARALLLVQASDWQFIISTGTAADYATERFLRHSSELEALLDGLGAHGGGEASAGGGDLAAAGALAAELHRRDDLFPDPLPALAASIRGAGSLAAA